MYRHMYFMKNKYVSDDLNTKNLHASFNFSFHISGINAEDNYQAFGFIYRDPANASKSFLCNFCNYISVSRKDFMQHSLIHVVQCGSCSFKAFTRLEVKTIFRHCILTCVTYGENILTKIDRN